MSAHDGLQPEEPMICTIEIWCKPYEADPGEMAVSSVKIWSTPDQASKAMKDRVRRRHDELWQGS